MITIQWDSNCFGDFEGIPEAIKVLEEKGWVRSKSPEPMYFSLSGDLDNVAQILWLDPGEVVEPITNLPFTTP